MVFDCIITASIQTKIVDSSSRPKVSAAEGQDQKLGEQQIFRVIALNNKFSHELTGASGHVSLYTVILVQ